MAKRTPSPEEISKAKAEFGDVWLQPTDVGDIGFHAPDRGAWELYVDKVAPTNTAAPQRALVEACVWFPDFVALGEILDKLPGIVSTMVREIEKAGGAREAAAVKKL